MRFVRDDEVRRGESVETSYEGLNRCDLNVVMGFFSTPSCDDPMWDGLGLEVILDLVNKFLPMREDPDAVAFLGRAFGDVGEDHGFSTAGRELVKRGAFSLTERCPDGIDTVLLIFSELDHDGGRTST